MNTIDIIKTAKSVIEIEINALSKVSDRIDVNFEKSVDLLSSANKIIISGVGKSGLIGKKIAATMSSVGMPALFLHPVEALHGDIGIVQKNDVFILLSKSGNTEELVKIIPFLKIRSAKIIAIVGNTSSFLASHSDFVLDGSVDKEACPFNLAPTSSTTAALAIGDALAVCSMKVMNFSLNDFSHLHPLGQIGRNVTLKVKDVMQKGNDLPLLNINASFKEALIKMSEKPLGCVCITENEKLAGIITDGDVRRILNKYDDIRGLMAKDVMTLNPITTNENAYLVEALAVMENRNSQINVLPVINEMKQIVGVIRLHDIVKSGS